MNIHSIFLLFWLSLNSFIIWIIRNGMLLKWFFVLSIFIKRETFTSNMNDLTTRNVKSLKYHRKVIAWLIWFSNKNCVIYISNRRTSFVGIVFAVDSDKMNDITVSVSNHRMPVQNRVTHIFYEMSYFENSIYRHISRSNYMPHIHVRTYHTTIWTTE